MATVKIVITIEEKILDENKLNKNLINQTTREKNGESEYQRVGVGGRGSQ